MADLLLKGVSLSGVSRCHLRKSLRARRMRLELRPDRSLLIVVPEDTREDQWLAFVLGKKQWIERNLSRFYRQLQKQESNDGGLPERIEFFCNQKQYVVDHRTAARNSVVEKQGRLSLLCSDQTEKKRLEILRRWLIEQARYEFLARLEKVSLATGLSWNRLSVRGQKTRWGSCSVKGNISLNFKMLFLPSELVDHVILHELVHTREMNHSSRFWALMRKYDPYSDRHNTELKKAGSLLPAWVVNL